MSSASKNRQSSAQKPGQAMLPSLPTYDAPAKVSMESNGIQARVRQRANTIHNTGDNFLKTNPTHSPRFALQLLKERSTRMALLVANRTAKMQQAVRTWINNGGLSNQQRGEIKELQLPLNVVFIKEQLQFLSLDLTNELHDTRTKHYYEYADDVIVSFYLLQLVAQLFKTDTARNALCMATNMKWIGVDVHYRSARKKSSQLSLDYGARSNKKQLLPMQYVQQVTGVAWDYLRTMAKSPSILKPTNVTGYFSSFALFTVL
ncbi:hypothetical protein BDF19DRAFT_412885 [Syncephalis fuscata]|nr:hypothetical protein BDF19DRAFT_412885 [Syncephalis fuscata]